MTGDQWLAVARQAPKIPSDWLGWVVIIVILLFALRAVAKALGK